MSGAPGYGQEGPGPLPARNGRWCPGVWEQRTDSRLFPEPGRSPLPDPDWMDGPDMTPSTSTTRPDRSTPSTPPPRTREEAGGADPTVVDMAVVGAGPCGIAAGAAARRAGLSTVLVDRGPLCASVVDYPWYMSFFSTPEKLEVEGLPFVTAEKNATRREALAYYRRVAEYFELPVRLHETVEAVEGREGDFRLRTRRDSGREDEIRARRIVLAIGGFHRPNLLDVPGEDLPKVSHWYGEAHPYWKKDVLVVGGSNSAVEASLELFRTGARVTMVHFGSDFDPGVKPWVLPDIRNRLEKGEIRMFWHHRVARIEAEEVVLREEDSGQTRTLANDRVLALTGWRPDPKLLRSLGVPVDPDTGVPEHDPETFETPIPGVHIAGVLAAGYDANRIFIENGRWHGRAIARAILADSGQAAPAGN
ncbi:MAG: YpdA family putative bacillithiol disulfide reductase [Gemmatimonadales bacterium]|nr:MAG: YpdA family putative bacillithiol disulfide reductase [Gemmatimonadales bacterium]